MAARPLITSSYSVDRTRDQGVEHMRYVCNNQCVDYTSNTTIYAVVIEVYGIRFSKTAFLAWVGLH